MPFTVEDAPITLPKPAQIVWARVATEAYEYAKRNRRKIQGTPEAYAAGTAWNVIKNQGYVKNKKTGKWVKKREPRSRKKNDVLAVYYLAYDPVLHAYGVDEETCNEAQHLIADAAGEELVDALYRVNRNGQHRLKLLDGQRTANEALGSGGGRSRKRGSVPDTQLEQGAAELLAAASQRYIDAKSLELKAISLGDESATKKQIELRQQAERDMMAAYRVLEPDLNIVEKIESRVSRLGVPSAASAGAAAAVAAAAGIPAFAVGAVALLAGVLVPYITSGIGAARVESPEERGPRGGRRRRGEVIDVEATDIPPDTRSGKARAEEFQQASESRRAPPRRAREDFEAQQQGGSFRDFRGGRDEPPAAGRSSYTPPPRPQGGGGGGGAYFSRPSDDSARREAERQIAEERGRQQDYKRPPEPGPSNPPGPGPTGDKQLDDLFSAAATVRRSNSSKRDLMRRLMKG